MRILFIIPLVLMSLMSSPSWGLTMDDLVEREGVYYKKFTDVPFTGQVNGESQGYFKNGKKDGAWVNYWWTGQLHVKINYKNGKIEGPWEAYHPMGQLMGRGYYKDNEKDGSFVGYNPDGLLIFKGNYKNGKQEGFFEHFYNDGSVNRQLTGTYKDDVKVSD